MLGVAFDRRLQLEFRDTTVSSDTGVLAFRELDDALGLMARAADLLHDPRTGKHGRHTLLAPFRQAVFERLAGRNTHLSAAASRAGPRCPLAG